jgi:hypothetical protein
MGLTESINLSHAAVRCATFLPAPSFIAFSWLRFVGVGSRNVTSCCCLRQSSRCVDGWLQGQLWKELAHEDDTQSDLGRHDCRVATSLGKNRRRRKNRSKTSLENSHLPTNSRNRNRRKRRNQSRKSHKQNRRHRQNNRNPTKSNNGSRNKRRQKKRRRNRRIASSNKDKPGNKTAERSSHRWPRTEKGNGFHQRNSSPTLGASTIFRCGTCRTAADFNTPVIGSRLLKFGR